MSEQATIHVEVAYALSGKQAILALDVPEGTTALEAAQQSGITDKFEDIDLENAKLGIFAKVVSPKQKVALGHKSRVGPLWLESGHATVRRTPGLPYLLSSRPLSDLLGNTERQTLGRTGRLTAGK